MKSVDRLASSTVTVEPEAAYSCPDGSIRVSVTASTPSFSARFVTSIRSSSCSPAASSFRQTWLAQLMPPPAAMRPLPRSSRVMPSIPPETRSSTQREPSSQGTMAATETPSSGA